MREADNDKNEEIDRLQATVQEMKKEAEEAAEYARNSKVFAAPPSFFYTIYYNYFEYIQKL
jgi:hypothetical protein